MFRVNFLCSWIVGNVLWVIGIDTIVGAKRFTEINNGELGFLQLFSLTLAGFVGFKVTFAIVHIIKIKLRVNCFNDMKVHEVNLKQDNRKLKYGHAGDSDVSLLTQE
jgi:TctA family transporter